MDMACNLLTFRQHMNVEGLELNRAIPYAWVVKLHDFETAMPFTLPENTTL